MNRFDKKRKLIVNNILAENRYLENKNPIKEGTGVKDSIPSGISIAGPIELDNLNIVKIDDNYMLVNKTNNTIEAKIAPVKYINSKQELCNLAFKTFNDLFESSSNVYSGGGEVITPLSSCKTN